MNELKSYLKLSSIWEDNDMFELKVIASNVDFIGTTDVYEQFENITEFAKQLVDFPKGDKTLFYEVGYKESYSYFSMQFYPLDKNGHIGVEVNIERDVVVSDLPTRKNIVKLEIVVEPSAIDNFQRQLSQFPNNGTAILYGDDNRLDL